MNILFVCTGNTCRSPMSEALLKEKRPQVNVQSAGLFAGENIAANQQTIVSLKNKGLDLKHQSQPVSSRLLNWADLVLTMTVQHKQALILQYPNYSDRFFTLKEYVFDKDKQVWDELKTVYATYEEKRTAFIQENQHKLDNELLDQKLTQHLQPDIASIQRLERSLSGYDISDPFGGDLTIYEKTLNEIDGYINKLVQKLKRLDV